MTIESPRIHYRDTGSGPPLLFLHGGWGYEIYPFDQQIEFFRNRFRILVPDRSGYGRSPRIQSFPTDFHRRAASETMSLMDALRLERPILWGHSDGAVIAALMGLAAPERLGGVILEAFHYYRNKPASRDFFEGMARDPSQFGERVTKILEMEHGAGYWKDLLVMEGQVWLDIADMDGPPDLYGGKLSQLSVPTLFLHGSRDPRTEPDELTATRLELPAATFRIMEGAGHSPHSEAISAQACNRFADEFIAGLRAGGRDQPSMAASDQRRK